jgi:chondroitin 4-sulfotransferase 11
MIISHKHKFIFVAIPKTGTSSIESLLGDFSTTKSHNKHDYLHQINNFNTDEYFSFCFVRNPWQRQLSTYFYYIKMIKFWDEHPDSKSEWIEIYNCYIKTLEGCDTFRDWVEKLYSNKWLEYHTWDPIQLIWANEVEYVGSFESLQEDFDTICDKIGIPRQKLPHENKSKHKHKHKHYTEYYDDETRQIVAEKYAKDIEYFGYKFGE